MNNLYTGSSTLPRPTTKTTDTDLMRSEKPVTTASTTSLYDNVTSSNQGQGQGMCSHAELLSRHYTIT